MTKAKSYVLRGIAGGIVLGGLASLAVTNNAGGKVAFAGSTFTGWGAVMVLMALCIAICVVVSLAAYVALQALTGAKDK
jgi:uncharacterized membrane protein